VAGKPATLPAGIRLADYLSTGLLARICPPDEVALALQATGRQSIRQRDLPAHAVAYYVMALSLIKGVSVICFHRSVKQFTLTPLILNSRIAPMFGLSRVVAPGRHEGQTPILEALDDSKIKKRPDQHPRAVQAENA